LFAFSRGRGADSPAPDRAVIAVVVHFARGNRVRA
jgi:hypothetical protein